MADVFGMQIPQWWLDWSGSIAVVISLVFLFRKHEAYWHFSNLSLLPYFLLFASGHQFMLAGLQVSYLVFGIHGFILWRLEARRDNRGKAFDEKLWYMLPWILSAAIFAYTVYMTDFIDNWAWLQFSVVSLALIANVGSTRKWVWSWYLWVVVNLMSAVLFWHYGLTAQFVLQFILAGMSVYGAKVWIDERNHPDGDIAF
jgi:nicotinamide mononucleotide transporter